MFALAPEKCCPAHESGVKYFVLCFFGLGHRLVAIFFVLSGYVCALKPLRLAGLGRAEETRICIARSTFRRVFRLVLPCTIATFIAWALAQLFNAFEFAKTVGTFWLNSSPVRIPGLLPPLRALFANCVRFFMDKG